MVRQERRRVERELQQIKILPSHEKLTVSTGIGVLVEMLYKSPFMNEIAKHLPESISHRYAGLDCVLIAKKGRVRDLGVRPVNDHTEFGFNVISVSSEGRIESR